MEEDVREGVNSFNAYPQQVVRRAKWWRECIIYESGDERVKKQR